MSLQLDQRQRAMLKEMGVQVWQPALPTGRKDAASHDRSQREDAALAAPGASVAGPTPSAVASAVVSSVAPRALPGEVASLDWESLRAAVVGCQACSLCQSRANTVFGVGDKQARWLVVGEAPGEQEDQQGEPFVGQAGQLLDNMLRAIGLNRQATNGPGVYIANVLKCRPPANRNPSAQEVAQCEPFLRRQVELLKPSIILAMGRFAAQSLLSDSVPDVASIALGKLRGQVHHYQQVPVVVTYHPAYLLRSPQDKAKAWVDLCLAKAVIQGQRTA